MTGSNLLHAKEMIRGGNRTLNHNSDSLFIFTVTAKGPKGHLRCSEVTYWTRYFKQAFDSNENSHRSTVH